MEGESRPGPAGEGQGEGMAQPDSPKAERVKVTCSFCDQSFEVLRPREGGRIRTEVQCSHCGRGGVRPFGRSVLGPRRLLQLLPLPPGRPFRLQARAQPAGLTWSWRVRCQ